MSSLGHSFYVLEGFKTLPAENYKQWLGRIVKNFDTPQANYTPKSIWPALIPEFEDNDDYINVDLLLKANKSKSAQAILQGLFKVSTSAASTGDLNIKPGRVRRVRLWNEDTTLPRIIHSELGVREALNQWLSVVHPVYWIVGFLVSDNVYFGDGVTEEKDINVTGEAPVNKVLAAVSAPTVTNSDEPLRVEYKSKESGESKLKVDTGPRIFAIEYKKLAKRLISTSDRPKIKPGPRGDRTFADDGPAGADGEKNLYEIVIDPDPLADADEVEHAVDRFLEI